MKKLLPIICYLLAAALAAWTAFAQVGAAVGLSVSGSPSGKSIYPTLVLWLAVWSAVYFLGLCVLYLIGRNKINRASLFRMAIFPLCISHFWFAFRKIILPGSAWILILGVLVALAAAAVFGIGSLFPAKENK